MDTFSNTWTWDARHRLNYKHMQMFCINRKIMDTFSNTSDVRNRLNYMHMQMFCIDRKIVDAFSNTWDARKYVDSFKN